MEEKKRIWTKAMFHAALKDLGVAYNKQTIKNNTDLDKLLADTLCKIHKSVKAEVIDPIRDALYDKVNGLSKTDESSKGEGSAPSEEPKSGVPDDFQAQCPTFGECDQTNDDCKACQNEFQAEYDFCLIKRQEASAASGKKKGNGKGKGGTVRSKYSTFTELETFLRGAPESRVTIALDKALLDKHSWKELTKIAGENNVRLEGNDFLTASRIKAHVGFREKSGWMFTKEGEHIQLTGYEANK